MVICWCERTATVRTCYCCSSQGTNCGFFNWLDPPMCNRAVNIIPGLLRTRTGLEVSNRALEDEVKGLK